MLEISQLGKRFDSGGATPDTAVLEHVDLDIDQHEIVSLVGTSGCGKSTLLRIVSGLETPSRGRVVIDGSEVRGPRAEIAMVFQEPRLLPWSTVAENVRLALLDLDKAEQDRRIEQTLHRVGLTQYANAWPRELSGGMAQRVAIARALAREPEILLLDEPFSALDSFTRASLQDHLLEIWERSRFTMLFVTHDLEEAVALADRIVVLRGRPGGIHRIFDVDLPRPRERSTHEFQDLKAEVARSLDLS